MTRQEIINAAISTVEQMRSEYVPRDTGNMAFNSLRYRVQDNYIVIYIDTNIAPYVPYTNEPWLSEKWHGKQNPNEGWWDEFAKEFSDRFSKRIRGKIK